MHKYRTELLAERFLPVIKSASHDLFGVFFWNPGASELVEFSEFDFAQLVAMVNLVGDLLFRFLEKVLALPNSPLFALDDLLSDLSRVTKIGGLASFVMLLLFFTLKF